MSRRDWLHGSFQGISESLGVSSSGSRELCGGSSSSSTLSGGFGNDIPRSVSRCLRAPRTPDKFCGYSGFRVWARVQRTPTGYSGLPSLQLARTAAEVEASPG